MPRLCLCVRICVTIPPLAPPHVTSTLLTISLHGRWSTSVPIGITHISCHYKDTIEGTGEKKNKRTNAWGYSRAERGVMQHYISDSIYGLTLAWITSENSTKQLKCRHLDSIFFARPNLMLPRLSARVSTVDRLCPCPVANCLSAPLSNQLSSRVPFHFRTRREFKSKTLCLVSRQNRQRNRLLGRPPT